MTISVTILSISIATISGVLSWLITQKLKRLKNKPKQMKKFLKIYIKNNNFKITIKLTKNLK